MDNQIQELEKLGFENLSSFITELRGSTRYLSQPLTKAEVSSYLEFIRSNKEVEKLDSVKQAISGLRKIAYDGSKGLEHLVKSYLKDLVDLPILNLTDKVAQEIMEEFQKEGYDPSSNLSKQLFASLLNHRYKEEPYALEIVKFINKPLAKDDIEIDIIMLSLGSVQAYPVSKHYFTSVFGEVYDAQSSDILEEYYKNYRLTGWDNCELSEAIGDALPSNIKLSLTPSRDLNPLQLNYIYRILDKDTVSGELYNKIEKLVGYTELIKMERS